MATGTKVKRNPNVSLLEIEVLVDDLEKHKHVLFSTQNNFVTNSKKRIIWESIAQHVNSVGVCGFQRTPDDIRRKWTVLCSAVKTKVGIIRLESKKTGGGQSLDHGLLTPIEERISVVMGPTAIGGIEDNIDTSEVDGSARMVSKCKTATLSLFPDAATSDATSTDIVNATDEAPEVFYLNTPYDVEATTTSYEPSTESLPVNESHKSRKADATSGPSGGSLEENLIGLEEKRLEIESKRLHIEERRLAVEEERLSVEKELLQMKTQKFSLYLSTLAGVLPTIEMMP